MSYSLGTGGLIDGCSLSENVPKVGSVGWSIQFDGGKTAHYPTRRFLETTHITLGGPMSYELKEVQTAERLRLTLRPAGGDELAYDFDVSGGADAIKKLNCPLRH